MNRDARKYKDKHRFYKEVIELGKVNFTIEILEECDKEDLLKREQFYYDKFQPTYNKVRPSENNFMHDEIKQKASLNSNTLEKVKQRKELYNTDEYIELFRRVHVNKMKPVYMIKDEVILKEFISIQEASRYITETTDYKGKNKTSKIKAVCDGDRKSAYGYNWKYSKV